MYRRVGQNPNERYSFRWQPQFRPDNNGEPEYLKKRLFLLTKNQMYALLNIFGDILDTVTDVWKTRLKTKVN